MRTDRCGVFAFGIHDRVQVRNRGSRNGAVRVMAPSHLLPMGFLTKFFVGPLTSRDGTVCTNANPQQSCFWMTIICFDEPQTRSIFARSTVPATQPCPASFRRGRAVHAGRTRRSPSSCGCHAPASPTKGARNTRGGCLASDRRTTTGSGGPSVATANSTA
jgi:hypothetical protein